jgi:hypothetical protein
MSFRGLPSLGGQALSRWLEPARGISSGDGLQRLPDRLMS